MNHNTKSFFDLCIQKIPHVGRWRRAFLCHSTPGHFYSPIPDLKETKDNEARIFAFLDSIPAINLRAEEQLKLLTCLASFANEYPYGPGQNERLRFTETANIYYTYHDAVVLYCIVRYLQPSKIIEVGSGYSSALLMDLNDQFLKGCLNLTFIEPYPEERLLGLIEPNADFTLKRCMVQEVPLEEFEKLQSGDILLIDSSHVSKVGSDLNYLLFNVLPVLAEGVYVHFHDVHYPFEYPMEWIYKGYSWNESYLLRSFLMYNNAFKIILMNSYLATCYPVVYNNSLNPNNRRPPLRNYLAGALWIQKC